MAEQTETRHPVEHLAEEFTARFRRGERPSIDKYAETYPEHASEIRELFPALVMMEHVAEATPPVAGAHVDTGVDPGGGPIDIEVPERIGRFAVERLIGVGGFGVVFEATDEQLQRRVALKIPRPETVFTPELRRRFEREAEAAASLDHPGIVPVYESGGDGVCFIASAYVEGTTLAEWFQREARQCDPRQAAMLIRDLADAVHHAHSRGVIHRDLKPANVLLATIKDDLESSLSPRITDFGLARIIDDNTSQTKSNAILGTAAYMAPEQADGRNGPVGTSADIHALGAILYELLTGRPPFERGTTLATLHAVRDEDAAPVSRIRRDIPRDLEAVCLRCLAKSPDARYPSAAALADDLRRFLAGESVSARAPGRIERIRRWARRKPGVATLTSAVAALLLVVLVGSVASAILLNDANRRTGEHLAAEIDARKNAQRRLYDLHKARAQLQRQSGRPGQRREALASLTQAAKLHEELKLGDDERLLLRNETIAVLALPDVSDPTRWPVTGDRYAFAVDRRFRRYAMKVGDRLLVRRIADDSIVASIQVPERLGGVANLLFSPDGGAIAFRTGDRKGQRLDVWKHGGAKPALSIPYKSYGRSFDFNRDGSRFAAGSRNGEIQLYSTVSFEPVSRFKTDLTISHVRFDSASGLIAVAGRDGRRRYRINILHAADGKLKRMLRLGSSAINAIAWERGGGTIAVATSDGNIRLWDATTGRTIRTLANGASCSDLNWHAAGRYLFSVQSGTGGTTRVWDVVTGRIALQMEGEYSELSRDGTRLSGLSGHRRFTTPRESGAITQPIAQTPAPAVHPDGRLMFTGSLLNHRWTDLETGRCIGRDSARQHGQLMFSPDGNAAYVANAGGLYRLTVERDSTENEEVLRIGSAERVFAGTVARATVAANGMIVAHVREEKEHRLIVLNERFQRESTLDVNATHGVNSDVSRDGSRVVVIRTTEPGAHLLEAKSGRLLRTWPAAKSTRAAFAPDGGTLAINDTTHVRLYDPRTGKKLRERLHANTEGIRRVAFSPSGGLLAITTGLNRVQLCHPATLAMVAEFELPRGHRPSSLQFTPDGRRLLATVYDRGWQLRVWDLVRIRRRLRAMNLDWSTPVMADAETRSEDAPNRKRLRVEFEAPR